MEEIPVRKQLIRLDENELSWNQLFPQRIVAKWGLRCGYGFGTLVNEPQMSLPLTTDLMVYSDEIGLKLDASVAASSIIFQLAIETKPYSGQH